MKRSNGRMHRLGIWDALAVAALAVALWYAIWAFAGIIYELHYFLNH